MAAISSSVVSKDQCIKIVKKHLQSDDFQFLGYTVTPLSDKPIGFLGEHLKLQASVLHCQQALSLSFFIKAVPKSVASHTAFVEGAGLMPKEGGLYSSVFRRIKSVQKELNDQVQTSWGPKSYFKTDDFIVLEDLTEKGLVDVRVPLDREHVVVSLKTLAHFHSASIVLEETVGGRPLFSHLTGSDTLSNLAGTKLSDLYPELLCEVLFTPSKGCPGNDYFEAGVTSLDAVIGLLDRYSSQEMEVIKREFPGQLRKMAEFVKPNKSLRNTISHGDLWSNNIMFRYENNQVVEARLVDFQMCRYNPPARDVMDMLHATTSRALREEHFEHFLEVYYKTLSDDLKSFNLDVATILSWSEFRDSCDYFREAGLCLAVFLFQLITLPPDISAKLLSSPEQFERNLRVDRTEMVTETFKKDKPFRDRLSEALYEMIDRYILKK